jgi:hypothetical protein
VTIRNGLFYHDSAGGPRQERGRDLGEKILVIEDDLDMAGILRKIKTYRGTVDPG